MKICLFMLFQEFYVQTELSTDVELCLLSILSYQNILVLQLLTVSQHIVVKQL